MKNICTVPTEIPPQCFLLSLSLLNNFKAIYIVFFLFFISVQFSCSVVSDSANHQKLGILLYNYNTVTTLKKSESNSIVLSNTQKSSSPIKKNVSYDFSPVENSTQAHAVQWVIFCQIFPEWSSSFQSLNSFIDVNNKLHIFKEQNLMFRYIQPVKSLL